MGPGPPCRLHIQGPPCPCRGPLCIQGPLFVAGPCGPGPAQRSPAACRLCPGADRVRPADPACPECALLLLPWVQALPRPSSTLMCASRLARLQRRRFLSFSGCVPLGLTSH